MKTAPTVEFLPYPFSFRVELPKKKDLKPTTKIKVRARKVNGAEIKGHVLRLVCFQDKVNAGVLGTNRIKNGEHSYHFDFKQKDIDSIAPPDARKKRFLCLQVIDANANHVKWAHLVFYDSRNGYESLRNERYPSRRTPHFNKLSYFDVKRDGYNIWDREHIDEKGWRTPQFAFIWTDLRNAKGSLGPLGRQKFIQSLPLKPGPGKLYKTGRYIVHYPKPAMDWRKTSEDYEGIVFYRVTIDPFMKTLPDRNIASIQFAIRPHESIGKKIVVRDSKENSDGDKIPLRKNYKISDLASLKADLDALTGSNGAGLRICPDGDGYVFVVRSGTPS